MSTGGGASVAIGFVFAAKISSPFFLCVGNFEDGEAQWNFGKGEGYGGGVGLYTGPI